MRGPHSLLPVGQSVGDHSWAQVSEDILEEESECPKNDDSRLCSGTAGRDHRSCIMLGGRSLMN